MESGAIILNNASYYELVYFKDVTTIFNSCSARPHIYKTSQTLIHNKNLKDIDELISSAIAKKKQYYTFTYIIDVNDFIKNNNIDYSWLYIIDTNEWFLKVRAIENKEVTYSQWISLDNMF